MASPKSPTAPVVRARFWTNMDPEVRSAFLSRRRRSEGPERTSEDSWAAQAPLANVVNYHHVGRSFESNPSDQDAEASPKTTRSFTEFEDLKLDGKDIAKFADGRGSSYKVSVDDLGKNFRSETRATPTKPVVLYVEVKRGDWPVRDARVEVTVTKIPGNDTYRSKEMFELLDSGSGGEPSEPFRSRPPTASV